MQKAKDYNHVKFSPEVISPAYDVFLSFLDAKKKTVSTNEVSVDFGKESWQYDSDEEFYSDCRKDCEYYTFSKYSSGYFIRIYYSKRSRETRVTIEGENRAEIEKVFEVFEKNADRCKLPEIPKVKEPPPPKPRIFIGHGNSKQWRDLKDHLHDKHGYDVEAYEIGARAGHAIRDILEDMLSKSSFALLVLTGEDRDEKGNLRARQNVIHELGLFQGKLGFARAIIILEEETEECSNIHGIHQIRYGKENIKETYGEILATLKREFG